MNNIEVRLFIAQLNFLKLEEKLLLQELFDDLSQLALTTKDDLQNIIKRKLRIKSYDPEVMADRVRKFVDHEYNHSIFLTTVEDQKYPLLLNEIYNPPYMLFYRGCLKVNDYYPVSIVGTRQASCGGLAASFKLGFESKQYNVAVISGLAKGIDAEAHWGAVKNNAYTVAVLGGGVDSISPKSNQRLASSILDNDGAIVSEYFPGLLPSRYTFPERNRIISGMSRAVVIVQAPAKSGALITAEYALEQGRDVFIHDTGLYGNFTQGTLELSENGASVIQSLDEIFVDDMNIEKYGKSCLSEVPADVGLYLAELIEAELEGKNIQHLGKYFRRY